MSDTPDPKSSPAVDPKPSEWRTPQVILPIIATIGTILAALIGVLPAIIQANKPVEPPTATAIVIAILATPAPVLINTAIPVEMASTSTLVPSAASTTMPTDIPSTSAPVAAPTDTPPTIVPTDAPTLALASTSAPVDAAPTSAPNITLFYDQDSFTILNHSGSRISLEGITFRGESTTWDISPFGGLMRSLPNNKCLRMRDATVGNRQPPSECGSSMYGFLEIGPTAIFWRGTSFDVVRDDVVMATCEFATGTCPVYVAPK